MHLLMTFEILNKYYIDTSSNHVEMKKGKYPLYNLNLILTCLADGRERNSMFNDEFICHDLF